MSLIEIKLIAVIIASPAQLGRLSRAPTALDE
jgi:hypothetical protein